MRWTFATIAAIGFGLVVLAQPPQKDDYRQPQSAPRPAPEWVRMVDLGEKNPELRGYQAVAGLKVDIVAREPTVVNPVGMTFDDQGTLYVLEWLPEAGGNSWPETKETVTYRDGTKREFATMKKKTKDVVKTLQRNPATGTFDKATVILNDVELPSSILVHDDWIYLTGRGSIFRHRRSRPEGPYDVKEEIAKGFCAFHHHQVSGLTLGNDGWLYVTSGDDDNYVEGSDRSRATVLRTGAVFRCRPDGSGMHVYSIGYRNPYRDVVFDSAFNVFHVDNDNEDGSKFTGCRLMHVAEESDFGWRLRGGAHCCVPDNLRGAIGGELPGKMAPLLKTGRGAPAGLLIYNESFLPERFRGLLLYPDVLRKSIRAYKVEPEDSTFVITEEFELMKSDDPLFRPCQMIVGPDGAIYVCDWRTNSGGAGQLWGDGKHGRIYRLSWDGTEDEAAIPLRGHDAWSRLTKSATPDLLAALDSPNFSDRTRATHGLRKRLASDTTLAEKLRAIVADQPGSLGARAGALGALQGQWATKPVGLVEALQSDEPDLRRLALEGAALGLPPGADLRPLQALLTDNVPAVRRAAALALGRIGGPNAAEALVRAYQFENERDPYLRDGLIRGIERLGEPGLRRLLELADSGRERDRQLVVEAFAALRTRAGYELLPRLLENTHLTPEEQAVLLRSFKDYLLDPPVSFTPLLDWLTKHTEAPQVSILAALESLSLAGQLKGERAEKTVLHLLQSQHEGVRLAALNAAQGLRLKAAGSLALAQLPRATSAEERRVLVQTLGVLVEKEATPTLLRLMQDANAAHLHAEALQALAAIDPDSAAKVSLDLLQRGQAGLQNQAIGVLGARPDGARQVATMFLEKKLNRETLAAVTEAVRKHVERHPDLQALLTEVVKGGLAVGSDPASLARLQALVKERGNPARGRDLYLNPKTLQCINCHAMEGIGSQQLGPDLTRLWDTMSVDKILEALLEPSKEIKEGYQSYQLLTKNGQVHRGLKAAQNDQEIVLRDAEGKEIRVAAAEVDQFQPAKQSIMPDNVIAHLSLDQLLDLVAFLKDRAAQESFRGRMQEFQVVGWFGGDLATAYPPEKDAGLSQRYTSEAGKTVGWELLRTEPSGYLNLRSRFNREYCSCYAQSFVYVAQATDAVLHLGSDDDVKVWLNGSVIHQQEGVRSAGPDQDRVPIRLQKGWNKLLFKVVNRAGGYGLFARVSGPEGMRVSAQPEGK